MQSFEKSPCAQICELHQAKYPGVNNQIISCMDKPCYADCPLVDHDWYNSRRQICQKHQASLNYVEDPLVPCENKTCYNGCPFVFSKIEGVV
ncbi:hypothetical protein [Methanosarcina siciliae]|uniref:hypothetical protein n=1 Tax=Methanosarcina siciliae TaxID=38027 RepID=UPI000B260AE7|nr:hypothetical protein [Methanosarcina siciliae]